VVAGVAAVALIGTVNGVSKAVTEIMPNEAVACATGDVDNNYIDGARETIEILESNGHNVDANPVYVGQELSAKHGQPVRQGTEVKLYVDADGDLTDPSETIECYK
jgi:hypothetical protein